MDHSPITTINGQDDSFVRRLHEVTQDSFEAIDVNDKSTSRGFFMSLGEFFKAKVVSQRVLGQVMGTLLNDEKAPQNDSLPILVRSLKAEFPEQSSKGRANIAKILSSWIEARKLFQDLLHCLHAR